MPARVIVVFSNAVEAQGLIHHRQGKFAGIDGTFFQRLENFTAGDHGDTGAKAFNHATTKASKTDF